MKLKSKLSSDNQSDIYKDAIESTGLLDKLSNDISLLDSDYIKLLTMESQLINMTESLSSQVCLFQHIIKYSEDIINITTNVQDSFKKILLILNISEDVIMNILQSKIEIFYMCVYVIISIFMYRIIVYIYLYLCIEL